MLDQLVTTLHLAQVDLQDKVAAPPVAGIPEGAAGMPAASVPVEPASPFSPLIFIGVMIAVFYFLLIRPQQKRQKKQKALMEGLKRGDSVITSSGIFGKIKSLEGNTVTLEIAPKTHIQVLRSHVGGMASPETEKELAQTAGQA